MPKILKKSKVSKTSKRHFTVVIKNKENGLYISSTPSLAAKKAVSKLCESNKQKKVEFYIREITQGFKKKTYGPYIGYLEQLNKSIKLKEYIIKYNTVVKLKKAEMRGGTKKIYVSKDKNYFPYFEIKTTKNFTNEKYKNFSPSNLVFNNKKYFNGNDDCYLSNQESSHTITEDKQLHKKSIFFNFREDITEDILQKFLENNKPQIIKKLEELGILGNVIIDLYVPYISDEYHQNIPNFKKIKYIKSGIDDFEITQNDISNMVEHVLSLENIKTNLRYLNMALKFIGINICLNFFGKFLSNFDDNLPIISVGSGTAYFEFLITRIFRREIICVDPDPKSYTPLSTYTNYISNKRPNTVFIDPKFKTVKDLLHANKSNKKYQNCLLLLNWPNPMSKPLTQSSTKYDPYDFNAIINLKPIGFFIVYETENGSGSEELIKVLKPGYNYSNIVQFEISEEEAISYELVNHIQKKEEIQAPIGNIFFPPAISNIYYRIAYYRRKKDISNLFNNNFLNE